jgi:autotransporter-associated beta strand protein
VFRSEAVFALSLLIISRQADAVSAQWNLTPTSGDWHDAMNWSPAGMPNGGSDTASFGVSSTTAVFLSAETEANSIVFAAGASAYTMTANSSSTFTISGTGIVNNSGVAQNFIAPVSGPSGTFTLSRILFTNSASAGSSTVFTIHGGAGEAINGGLITFRDNSTAGSATLISNGSSHPAASGGRLRFEGASTAGNATLIANSGNGGQRGSISFAENSSGGTARVILLGGGTLDIGGAFGNVTIGSLEGDGRVSATGSRPVIVGSNNLSTTFSGVIEGSSRGLSKIGTGTLTLSGANLFQGGSGVHAGQLIVNGSIIAPLKVVGGILGGSGTTAGVTVYDGAALSPGTSAGILHVEGNLGLNLGATYLVDLNGTALGSQYDQTDVAGSVRLSNATLSLQLGFVPAAGDQFTIINNDGADAVSGTFLALPEGGVVVTGGQVFSISYVGGDGNDVVLTSVIPEAQTWMLFGIGAIGVAASLRRNAGGFR